VIAAGALVPEQMEVPAGSLVMGVPGRIVRTVDAALAERIAGTWRRYVAHAKRHRNGEWPIASPP
jgi:carbonic anhydrase/acetyltransferase-like protein (isoleucine patch superfamily)